MLVLGLVASELMLTHLVGVCPLLAVSKKLETAAGLACAIILVQPVAIGLFFLLKNVLPDPFASANVALPLVVLCNLAAVQGVTLVGQRLKGSPFLLSRPFMSILNINCVLLGVTLLTLEAERGMFFAFGLAAGYAFTLVIVAEIRVRLDASSVPLSMRGAPIILLTLGIISMAIQGIQGS
jgi:Na+-translocating ferredoxin:NAD+ oxidoreductase subunit A